MIDRFRLPVIRPESMPSTEITSYKLRLPITNRGKPASDHFCVADNPGTISPCDLGARCLTATTCKACASSLGRAGTTQFRSDWFAIRRYNPRMASLRHGFEEPKDVQDIRLVVDTIPTLAWSARPDGSAEFFNQRWLDYTGLSAKQALDSGWQVAIHPDDLPGILETFREALDSVRQFEVEGRFRRFAGEFRWFLFRGSPLRDRSGTVPAVH